MLPMAAFFYIIKQSTIGYVSFEKVKYFAFLTRRIK